VLYVPDVAVGAIGVPVGVGAKVAFKFNAVCVG
jgi:hypothetical protein